MAAGHITDHHGSITASPLLALIQRYSKGMVTFIFIMSRETTALLHQDYQA
jgi:hypothetical protein